MWRLFPFWSAARKCHVSRNCRNHCIAAGVTHLLLDNLTPEEATDQVRWIAGRAKVELSGGIALDNVRVYAETGADFVSSGAITHSAPAVDISFRLSHPAPRCAFAVSLEQLPAFSLRQHRFQLEQLFCGVVFPLFLHAFSPLS